MKETPDVFRYMGYVAGRWRLVAGSCAVAVSLAVIAGVVSTRLYTATARIVIEPPAGSDPRGSMAVSPIYLESLRTYEHFAESDSLFQKASDRFGLRRMLGARPIEALEKRVLKVAIVRNTRILEISATLPDATAAQALAHFVADETVTLNQSLVNEGDRGLVTSAESAVSDAGRRVEDLDKAWAQVLASEPVEDLQAAIEAGERLREDLEQQAVAAQLEIADCTQRAAKADAGDAAEIHRQMASAQVRLEELRKRIDTAAGQASVREKELATRSARRDTIAAQRKDAQDALTAAEGRLRAVRAEAGYRGERLTVIDPGVVPERPSSPNLPLDFGAALLIGAVLPVLYLLLEMNYREQRSAGRRSRLHAMEKVFDE